MEIVGNPILDTELGAQVAGGADLVGVGVGLEPAECGCLGSRKVGVDLSLVSCWRGHPGSCGVDFFRKWPGGYALGQRRVLPHFLKSRGPN